MSDYCYMSLGAGVQSGTMAEMIAEGELEVPDVILFADTGDEPSYVYEYLDYLRTRLNGIVEIVTVSAGNLVHDLQDPSGRFAGIPAFSKINGRSSRLRRQCTSEYKIEPIERELKKRLLSKGLGKKKKYFKIKNGVSVECWLGISLDEVARMKPNQTRWIENRWPLIEKRMSRNDCIQWLKKRDLPIPGRSSCRICPYHSDEYWRSMKNQSPDDWAYVSDFDKSLRDNRSSRFIAKVKGELFLHRDLVPLSNVDLRTPEQKGQLRLFDDDETVCDGGYCFV